MKWTTQINGKTSDTSWTCKSEIKQINDRRKSEFGNYRPEIPKPSTRNSSPKHNSSTSVTLKLRPNHWMRLESMCCTGTRNPLRSLTPMAQRVSQKTSRGRGDTEQRWTKQLGQQTSSSWSPNFTEPKTHGGREREVTATNSKEKGHARPWQAALARTMKTTTGHGELFPAERTSRPPGPHG